MKRIVSALGLLTLYPPQPALAWDASKANRYPSVDLYRPEADRYIAHDRVTAPTVEAERFTGPTNALAEIDAPVGLPIFTLAPQMQFRGRQYTVRTAPPSGRGYAYAGQAATLIDPGSGKNGPLNAGYGLMLSTIKQMFPGSNSKVGELNTLSVNARQSGPVPTTEDGASDLNGIQGNVQTAGDPGFNAFIEAQTSRIDSTSPYSQTHSLRTQIGVIDPFGKNGEQGKSRYAGINRLSFGYGAIADHGALDRAFYAINNGGTFDDFLYLGRPGNPLFRIKGEDGSLIFGPDPQYFRIFANRDALQFLDKSGTSVLQLLPGSETAAPKIDVSGTVIFRPQPAFPKAPVEGQTAYLASTHKLYTWDGKMWQAHW